MERGKSDRTRKEKEERMRGKPSRQEKERERAEKAREKEMQRMEKKQVKLDREKDRLEKERQRTLQRQAELEEMKGRLTVLEPGGKDGNTPTATSSSKTPQAQAQAQAHASAPKSSTLASAQNVLQRKLGASLHPSVPGAQPDWCPEDKASDVSFGDDSTSVTDDLTSSNIASLERANERLRREVEKREGEYRTLQEEVRTLSSKVTRLRQQSAADLADITQEVEGGGGASGGVEVGVEELERTVQELEQRIVQMENAGDLLAESMETAAIGKWQSLEGEEVVGQQLSDMVDQMKAMLQQASAAAQRLPPLLPPPLTPANFPLHHHHPSGSEQKSSGGPRNFERVYSHAMKLQVQMNNLRLSQLERNKEILLIKQQLLLQEVNNVLMQASIRRREKDLHQFALSRQQQAAAHLKRWNTFSVQGANGSLPPLLRKLNVRDTEGVTPTKPTKTSSLKAKRTTTNLPTSTTTTATTTAATTTTTTTAGLNNSPVTSKPPLQSKKQSRSNTPVTPATQGVEGSGVGTTPVPSTNQEVEGSGGVQTPVSSTKQGVEGSGVETPATSTNQGVEGSGQKTPGTSTNQGVERSDVETPATLINQEAKGSGVKTPLTSANQGVEGSGMQTPDTSTNQGVDGSGVSTPVTSTNEEGEKGSASIPATTTNQRVEAETPDVPMAPLAESDDTHTQVMSAAQGEPGTESREADSTLNTGDISTADEESHPESLPTPTPGQLAISTTTTTTITSTTPVPEENMSITAIPSEKSTPGTSEVTTSANSSEPGENTLAAESSLEENVSVSATIAEEKEDVTEQGSATISAPAVESEDMIVTDAEKSEDVKVPDAERVSLPSAENADDNEKNVECVSDARADHLEDTESSLSERLSFPPGTVDPCVSSPSFPGTAAETNVTSVTTAPVASAARPPISSAVTAVTPPETPSKSSATTTVGKDSNTATGDINGPNTTHEDNVPKTSTSWQRNVSEQQQQRTGKERLHATESATNNTQSESSSQPETSPEKALRGSGKQITMREADNRTTRKTLSTSSSSLHAPHLGSRARRIKPAAELLQESQRYRSGHSVYATRIMNRYLPSRSSQPGSPSPWDRNTTADSRRVCRDGVPLRSPGSSGASSSLSLHRADSPSRTHAELMSHVAHRLSSSSGYIARARLGKTYSSCSTVCAEFPTGDSSDGAAAPGVNEEEKTTLPGQALSSASHFSASAASKGSMPEGDRPHSRPELSEEKQSVPQTSLPVVNLEGTEQRDTGRGNTTQDSTPGRASIGHDRDLGSGQSQSRENTPAQCSDPTQRALRGGKEKTPPSSPSEQPSTGSSIPDVTSESMSDPVTSTVTPSTSSPSDVTTGQVAGKKKSRSRILNISWFQKPKKFFTTSK